MFRTVGPFGLAGAALGFLLVAATATPTAAQSPEGFLTSTAARAYDKWAAAMQAILEHNGEAAEAAFGELIALDPSPLRVALLADYTVQRTPAAGAVLLFEQDMDAKTLGPNAQQVAARLVAGREQKDEADDAWYYSQIGRFDVAEANFKALLGARPDPVALLEFTDQKPKRREILVQLTANATLGPLARDVLKLLAVGELAIKADPLRIKENLDRLAGPPRGFENAAEALKDSGEYGIPFLVQYLRDPAKKSLMMPILRVLPTIDRPAVNPLVIALRMDDPATKRYLIEALGKMGYAQAVPYLLQLVEDARTPAEVKSTASAALDAIRAHGAEFDPRLSASEAFYQLAQDYYNGKPSLSPDVRLDTANAWYWRDNMLVNIEVPTPIFNDVMAMRCCEEALRLNNDAKPPLALWLAANLRREADLPAGQTDRTRPDNFPSGIYFAQSAGPEYCLLALARGVDRTEAPVALGTIQALRTTAGPASLITDSEGRLPLAEALSFPDRMVRIRAGLTLGNARPVQQFKNYQNLMPVLSEALLLHGGARNALVVDADVESANTVAGILRTAGYEVTTDASLFEGLRKVREQLPGIDVIFVASDLKQPDLNAALAALRGEFRFAITPVIIITKPGDTLNVRMLVRNDHRLGDVPANPAPADVTKAIAAVAQAVGAQAMTPDVGAELALDAAGVLRQLALTNNPVFNVADAEAALLTALESDRPELKLAVAEVLGYIATNKAQEAIAKLALDTKVAEDMRVKMFTALADAAKRRGNLLNPELVKAIVTIAASDPNMTIREAASRTLLRPQRRPRRRRPYRRGPGRGRNARRPSGASGRGPSAGYPRPERAPRWLPGSAAARCRAFPGWRRGILRRPCRARRQARSGGTDRNSLGIVCRRWRPRRRSGRARRSAATGR